MEAAKALFSGNGKAGVEHKDKLAAKKQHEKEVHGALKLAQREKKEEGKDKKAADKALLKEERMLHDTRRAHTDARHQAKKEEKKDSGATCEHGVWKCRICYPVGDHR